MRILVIKLQNTGNGNKQIDLNRDNPKSRQVNAKQFEAFNFIFFPCNHTVDAFGSHITHGFAPSSQKSCFSSLRSNLCVTLFCSQPQPHDHSPVPLQISSSCGHFCIPLKRPYRASSKLTPACAIALFTPVTISKREHTPGEKMHMQTAEETITSFTEKNDKMLRNYRTLLERIYNQLL